MSTNTEHDYSQDLSDEAAVEIIGLRKGDQDRALTHLEVSINGGDLATVRTLALDLLHLVEVKNGMIEDLLR